jgi:hypothetical protein
MCSLCGQPGTRPHWTEAGGADPAERRRGRAARLAAARALLATAGLTVSDWQGQYLVGDGRGRTALVGDLGGCWVAAEQLLGRPVDPLEV